MRSLTDRPACGPNSRGLVRLDKIMRAIIRLIAPTVIWSLFCPGLYAQHLFWDLNGQQDATCLYGTITVLATTNHIYYCGANWHPGEAAGGYCGIQDIAPQ